MTMFELALLLFLQVYSVLAPIICCVFIALMIRDSLARRRQKKGLPR